MPVKNTKKKNGQHMNEYIFDTDLICARASNKKPMRTNLAGIEV